MEKTVTFKVDPKLAELLGETYKSTEDSLKELVDNSYDADADNVWITLPEPFSENPVIRIVDDGTGMKEHEVRNQYLKIASSRLSRKGDKTVWKKRTVKGRKGIGKFAGLMVAEIMEVKTRAGGKETTVTIVKEELAKAKYDLEKVKLPTNVIACDKAEHGTVITLQGLNQNFNFPNPERLKEVLVLDYGRVNDFAITVNDERTGVQDYQGKTIEKVFTLNNGKTAKLVYTITEKATKQAGLIFRVGNKIVGRPENFLKDDEIIPEKLQRRVVGEIVCDDLEDFVTADHGAIIENSKLADEVRNEVKTEVTTSLNEVFKTDMHLARLRYQQKINRELEKLPAYKRGFAEKSLQRVLEKFYGESEEKVNSIISVMVDALEKDAYWNVIQHIEEARDRDIETIADALSEFGLVEMSIVTGQAHNRLRFLDEAYLLQAHPDTLEITMHKALENNLWIFGNEYNLIFSNKTLAKAIEDYLNKKFTGKRASKRPDLFLGNGPYGNHLLIEFKRPSETVGRDAERQALEYRDDLNSVLHDQRIQIIVLGGKVDGIISSHNERPDVKLRSYINLIADARAHLNWLLKELAS